MSHVQLTMEVLHCKKMGWQEPGWRDPRPADFELAISFWERLPDEIRAHFSVRFLATGSRQLVRSPATCCSASSTATPAR